MADLPAPTSSLTEAPTANGDTATQPSHAASPPPLTVAHEHQALVRHLARVQQRMTALVRTHQQQLSHWQDLLMRQSIRLLLARTQLAWLTPSQPLPSPSARSDGVQSAIARAQAEALICRSGCTSQADHWREGPHCKRTGNACVLEPDAPTRSPTSPAASPGNADNHPHAR